MQTARRDEPMESRAVTTAVGTMRASVQDEYGTVPEEVLRLEQVDKPTSGHDEVLVRVHAASADRGTWHVMAGLPYPIRVAGFGLRRPKAPNPGRSVAGTVESVGTDVTALKPGAEVYGTCDGSLAEEVRARAERLAPETASRGRTECWKWEGTVCCPISVEPSPAGEGSSSWEARPTGGGSAGPTASSVRSCSPRW